MSEERAEATPSAEQPNKRRIQLLFGIALTLVILMIMLVLAALGFLLYGLIAARLAVSIIGVVACVIGFGLLFALFRLVNNITLRQTHGQEDQIPNAMATGKQTYAKWRDELSIRYQRAKNGEY
jgi:flagellar basal body-associated protein FliL